MPSSGKALATALAAAGLPTHSKLGTAGQPAPSNRVSILVLKARRNAGRQKM